MGRFGDRLRAVGRGGAEVRGRAPSTRAWMPRRWRSAAEPGSGGEVEIALMSAIDAGLAFSSPVSATGVGRYVQVVDPRRRRNHAVSRGARRARQSGADFRPHYVAVVRASPLSRRPPACADALVVETTSSIEAADEGRGKRRSSRACSRRRHNHAAGAPTPRTVKTLSPPMCNHGDGNKPGDRADDRPGQLKSTRPRQDEHIVDERLDVTRVARVVRSASLGQAAAGAGPVSRQYRFPKNTTTSASPGRPDPCWHLVPLVGAAVGPPRLTLPRRTLALAAPCADQERRALRRSAPADLRRRPGADATG